MIPPYHADAVSASTFLGGQKKMKNTTEPATLLSVRGVARMLAVHPQTIRRMIARAEFPRGVRIGSRLRWQPATVRRWISARETAAAAG